MFKSSLKRMGLPAAGLFAALLSACNSPDGVLIPIEGAGGATVMRPNARAS